MQHIALTAKYRPQTFAQVAGQDTLKSILSRACLEDRVAPAYLFSGTRGVGKTTLARIFAKALNCRTAPTAEPCNNCDQCRAVTAGNAVDVVEIDGASNRGIDDVRRLREVVGYAAMEGRYKIFIIDEAHMLSREAFNALLKTLEEPPARVTFILATTEPHKFPATIVSRCQHYVFKRLPEQALTDHLSDVLTREGLAFEASALRLIARRGAGSVRDSMSLLGQVIALGRDSLTEASARSVLGLAGQEVYLHILQSVKKGDCAGLSLLLRELLDQGLDMGFFLRELSSLWRNLFMLRQSGAEALTLVDLPENEARQYLELGEDMPLQHIHACWQMTLEGQRRVLTSLEPALALELLLLNLAMLPRLLSLESLSPAVRKGAPPSSGPASSPASPPSSSPSSPGPPTGPPAAPSAPEAAPMGASAGTSDAGTPAGNPAPEAAAAPAANIAPAAKAGAVVNAGVAANESFIGGSAPAARPSARSAGDDLAQGLPDMEAEPDEAEIQNALNELYSQGALSAVRDGEDVSSRTCTGPPAAAPVEEAAAASEEASAAAPCTESPAAAPGVGLVADCASPPAPGKITDAESGLEPEPGRSLDWEDLLALCAERELPGWFTSLMRSLRAVPRGRSLELLPPDAFSAERLREEKTRALLDQVLAECCRVVPEVFVGEPLRRHRTQEDIRNEVLRHPLVVELKERFGARYIDSGEYR